MTHARFARLIRRFVSDERGATAIEYAMIAAGVGATIAGIVMSTGNSVKGLFDSVAAAVNQ